MRHGDTDWSLAGRNCGATDIGLNKKGQKNVSRFKKHHVGSGKWIDPEKLIDM